ncbi:hypothetical protein EMCRGX_G012278 [Ephydatia muelleri]
MPKSEIFTKADLGLLEAFSALDEGNDEAKPVSKSCNDEVSSAVGVDADDSSKGLFEADDELASASPGPVGNMKVTSLPVDQLTVTWTPPTTGGVPTSYNVTINDSSSPVVIADNGSPVYTHTFTGLVSDTLYTVSVVAINYAGSSNGTSFVKRTMALPPDNTTIKAVSVFNPNNTLRHLEITWTPVGGAVTIYGVYLGGGIHGYTSCTIPQCFYVVPVSVASTSYVISVASVNKDGDMGPKSNTTIYGTTNNTIINSVTAVTGVTMATIACSFLNNQSFYCMVCCSTDPSVPPDSSVYNISTTRSTEVSVSLQGLTSGQMYYCKAAATNTNSNNCTGPVVGGVKVFFSFISDFLMTPPTPSATNGESVSSERPIIIGVTVSDGVVIISIIVIILIVIYMTRITGKATITAMCTVQSTVPPPSR